MDLSMLDPAKVGLWASVTGVVVLVLRTMQTRSGVPGPYYHEMRQDRDDARKEARQALSLLETLTGTHEKLVDEHVEFTSTLRRKRQ